MIHSELRRFERSVRADALKGAQTKKAQEAIVRLLNRNREWLASYIEQLEDQAHTFERSKKKGAR